MDGGRKRGQEEGSRELQRGSSQTPADAQPHKTTWLRRLSALRPGGGWCSCAPVAVLWSVCRADERPNPCVFALDVCGRILLVCLLWVVVGGCVQALKRRLRPGHNQTLLQFKGEPRQRTQQEAVAENTRSQHSRESLSWGPGHRAPPALALALADSLLLCVLQEPLPDPGVAHIQALLRRLESVSRALETADTGSDAPLNAPDRDLPLTDRVKLIHAYLQQRTRSVRALVLVQTDFEARAKDMLGGLDGLWAQLEELHTEVTITKEASRGHRDLASAQSDAETLFSALGHYRSKLQSCQADLKRGTQLLQELIWSHTHVSNSVSSSGESLWPELLLQCNIEQFDTVRERFLSLEQQTRAFQAHLEGLGHGARDARAGPPAHISEAHSCAASRQASPRPRRSTSCASQERRRWPASASADEDTDAEAETPLSLCERSALQFSSTIERLRKSARRK